MVKGRIVKFLPVKYKILKEERTMQPIKNIYLLKFLEFYSKS